MSKKFLETLRAVGASEGFIEAIESDDPKMKYVTYHCDCCKSLSEKAEAAKLLANVPDMDQSIFVCLQQVAKQRDDAREGWMRSAKTAAEYQSERDRYKAAFVDLLDRLQHEVHPNMSEQEYMWAKRIFENFRTTIEKLLEDLEQQ